MNKRIYTHPILENLSTNEEISFSFNSETLSAYKGDTIATALLANQIRTLRYHEESGSPRGIYCNIGHCFECRVTVNDYPGIRACLTLVEEDMVITSGKKLPQPLKHGGEENA
ncbi:(2Fe-2S)-binding protein [Natribacillus halophilus]|uniref:Sarcosine oxidase subunit alpha n=1 Tax=Natribacillus halophilus TaxID=549003 RepID=A0A1G8R8M9_9BACI|nr:(2Fe-2S)-binding protein [Natribacillus halophilus]SDJ13332.1 sarcosine oxidase subunit alpha [Natribacillus halophilus]